MLPHLPHRLRAWRVRVPIRILTALVLVMSIASSSRAEGDWSLRSEAPPPRYDAAAVVDTVNGTLYLYGGTSRSVVYGWGYVPTIEYDLSRIDLATGSAAPVPTSGPAPPRRGGPYGALFDAERNQLVFIGGWPRSGDARDVWLLSLATMQWSKPTHPGGPIGIGTWYMPSVVLDAARDRLLLWGGTLADSVWSYSLTGAGWSWIDAGGTHPPHATQHVAVFDPVRDRMLVHGGQPAPGMWALSFDPPTWSVVSVPAGPPTAASAALGFWDPIADGIVVAGFMRELSSHDPQDAAAAWEITSLDFAGESDPSWTLHRQFQAYGWTDVPPLWRPAIAWDPRARRLLAFGGARITYVYVDPYGYDHYASCTLLDTRRTFDLGTSTSWEPAAMGPPVAEEQVAAFDAVGHRLFVVANTGATRAYEMPLEGTAIGGYREIGSLASAVPGGLRQLHLVVDVAGDRLVVFGTDASNARVLLAMPLHGEPVWSILEASGTPPGPRDGSSAVYDPTGHRMLFFGGDSLGVYKNETFVLSLDGTPQWTRLTGGAPWARSGHVAVYDPQGDRMLIHGGRSANGYRNDTWQLALAGTPTWSPVPFDGFIAIPGRTGASGAMDVARHRLLIFGGRNASIAFDDMWALPLDASDGWQSVTPATSSRPSARHHAASAFDVATSSWWTMGGFTFQGQPLSEVWTFTDPSVLDVDGERPPVSLALSAPSPNPTRQSVSFTLGLPTAGSVRLEVFDVGGRTMRVAEHPFEAGRRTVTWDGRDAQGAHVDPGLYFVRVSAAGAHAIQRVVVTH